MHEKQLTEEHHTRAKDNRFPSRQDYYRFIEEEFPENIRLERGEGAEGTAGKTKAKAKAKGARGKKGALGRSTDAPAGASGYAPSSSTSIRVAWIDRRVLGADWLGVFERVAPRASREKMPLHLIPQEPPAPPATPTGSATQDLSLIHI